MPADRYEELIAALHEARSTALPFRAEKLREPYHAGMAPKVARALEDADPAVAHATTALLDRMIAAHPQALDELVDLATDDNVPIRASLHRYLLHVGTPDALHALLEALSMTEIHADFNVLAALIGEATAMLPDARFEAMIQAEKATGGGPQARIAETILARRGNLRVAEDLFDHYPSATMVREFVAKGPDGIRLVCRGASRCPDASDITARPLAELREATEATVYALADDPTSKADRAAVRVLGKWDEPRAVETLLRIAKDAARSREVREAALESLCELEAVEAIDVLAGALADPEKGEVARARCAEALGEIGNYTAIEALEAAARREPEGMVGESAAAAIANIRGDRGPRARR